MLRTDYLSPPETFTHGVMVFGGRAFERGRGQGGRALVPGVKVQ